MRMMLETSCMSAWNRELGLVPVSIRQGHRLELYIPVQAEVQIPHCIRHLLY